MASGLTFNIYGHDVSAGKTLQGVQRQADHSAKQSSASWKKAAGVIGAAFTVDKVKDFFKSSMDEARESQKVSAQTAAVLKSTGGAAHVTAQQVGTLATAISKKAGIDDEAIQSGENLLLTFRNIRNEAGKGNDIFNQSTQAVTDMSVALGQDMKSSAIQVGKALNDPIKGLTALQRVGVTFDAQQRTQIATMVKSGNTLGAQKVILAELTKEFGGSAAAQATAGEKMKVAWLNLKEQVGTALIPVIDKLEGILTNDLIPAFSGTVTWLQKNWHWFKYVAAAVGTFFAAWKVHSIATAAIDAVQLKMATLRTQFGRTAATVAESEAAQTRAVVVNSDRQIAAMSEVQAVAARGGMAGGVGGVGGVGAVGAAGAGRGVVGKVGGRLLTAGGIYLGGQLLGNAITGGSRPGSARNTAGTVVGDAAKGAAIGSLAGPLGTAFGTVVGAGIGGLKTGSNEKSLDKQLSGFITNMEKAKKATEGATVAEKINAAAVKSQADATRSANAAQANFAGSLSLAKTLVQAHGASLNANTQAGKTNRQWLLQEIDSVRTVASEQIKAGVSTSTVTGKFHENEAALRRAAIAAGFNKDQVDAMIKKYGAVPKSVTTAVRLHDDVTPHIKHIQDRINSLHGKTLYIAAEVRITRGADVLTAVGAGAFGKSGVRLTAQGTGYLKHYAQGGRVRTWVGENGPEILSLPVGSQMTPTSAAMSQARMTAGGDTYYIEINMPGGSLATRTDVQNALIEGLEHAARSGKRMNIGKAIVG